jgi:hypothetical protein
MAKNTSQQPRIEVRMRPSSPTISLSSDGDGFEIIMELRLASSAQEGRRPITVALDGSCFEEHEPGAGGFDAMAQGRIDGLFRAEDALPTCPAMRLGNFRVNSRAPADWTADLRERGTQLLTLPGDGSPATVHHRLDWGRIFKYAEMITKDDLQPGQRFKARINPRSMITSWWSWGDIDGDLKDKKLHYWTPGYDHEEKPDEDFIREGNWVLGEEGLLLNWEDRTENGWAVFEIAE